MHTYILYRYRTIPVVLTWLASEHGFYYIPCVL